MSHTLLLFLRGIAEQKREKLSTIVSRYLSLLMDGVLNGPITSIWSSSNGLEARGWIFLKEALVSLLTAQVSQGVMFLRGKFSLFRSQ
jgi:hypothetical protein